MSYGRDPYGVSPYGAESSSAAQETFTLAVTATQSAHTAAAVVVERFIAAITASQSPAIAAVQATQQFVASLAAVQAPATASVSLSTPLPVSLEITATQAPHSANAALGNPDAPVAGIGGAAFVVIRPYVPPLQPRASVAITATQRAPTCRAELETRSEARVLVFQRPHRATAAIDAAPFSDQELLFAVLAAA